MSPSDQSIDETIDADHPRPGRATPYRTGGGHGDEPATGHDGLTGDEVDQPDVAERDRAAEAEPDDVGSADVDRYLNSPGAGLLRDEDPLPEPNEPA